MRVLYVTTVLGGDGASRALEALVSHLSPTFEARVCSLTRIDARIASRLALNGVRVDALGMSGRFDMKAPVRLAALCRRWRPAVIHTQLSRADWIGRVVGAATGVPVTISTIQNVHSLMYQAEFGRLGARTGLALDRCTAPLVTQLVAVSEGVRRDLRGHGMDHARIAVIPNGVDLGRRELVFSRASARAALGIGDDEIVLGTSALLKPQKGIDTLVDAVVRLWSAGARVTAIVIGDGPLRPWLERTIASMPSGRGRVRLLGWMDDAMAWMPAFDVFVLPSRWEGLPIALLEAVSLGLPAVGMRVAGIEDVLQDGVTGWLVTPDRADVLASTLEHVLSLTPDDRALVAATGRALVERRFSAHAVAAAHEVVYRELLASAGGRRIAA